MSQLAYLPPGPSKERRRLEYQSLIESSYLLFLTHKPPEDAISKQGEFDIVSVLVPLDSEIERSQAAVEVSFLYRQDVFFGAQIHPLPKGYVVRYQAGKKGEMILTNGTSAVSIRMDTPFELTAL